MYILRVTGRFWWYIMWWCILCFI